MIGFDRTRSRIQAVESVPPFAKPKIPCTILSDSMHGPENRMVRDAFARITSDLPCSPVESIQPEHASDPQNSTFVLKYRHNGAGAQAVRIVRIMAVSSEWRRARVEPVDHSWVNARPDSMVAILQQGHDSTRAQAGEIVRIIVVKNRAFAVSVQSHNSLVPV